MASKGHRLHFQHFRQRALLDAFILPEVAQHAPLRPCQAKTARPFVEALAHQARNVVQQESEDAFLICLGHDANIMS
jgi:hypothetical protein